MENIPKKRTLGDFISWKEADILSAEYRIFNRDLSKAIKGNDYKTIGEMIVSMVAKYYFGKKVVSHMINHILVNTPNDGSYEYQKLMNVLGTQFCAICYNNYTTIHTLYGWLKNINVENAEDYDVYSNLMYEYLVKDTNGVANQITQNIEKLKQEIYHYTALGSIIGSNLGEIDKNIHLTNVSFDDLLKEDDLTVGIINDYYRFLDILQRKPDYTLFNTFRKDVWSFRYTSTDKNISFVITFGKKTNVETIFAIEGSNNRFLIIDGDDVIRYKVNLEDSTKLIEAFTTINVVLEKFIKIMLGEEYLVI